MFLAYQLAVYHVMVMQTSFQYHRKNSSLLTLPCYKYSITFVCSLSRNLKWTSYIFVLYNFEANSGNVRFICLAAQTLAEKQSSVKVFFITQIRHRPRASNSKRGPNEDLKKIQGRIMTILELQYDADAKKAVPETY